MQARYSNDSSLRLSVCPSLCLSNACIVAKRKNVAIIILRRFQHNSNFSGREELPQGHINKAPENFTKRLTAYMAAAVSDGGRFEHLQ